MIKYTTKLSCDADGCKKSFSITPTDRPVSQAQMRRWARTDGWVLRLVPETADLCPDHAHSPR